MFFKFFCILFSLYTLFRSFSQPPTIKNYRIVNNSEWFFTFLFRIYRTFANTIDMVQRCDDEAWIIHTGIY